MTAKQVEPDTRIDPQTVAMQARALLLGNVTRAGVLASIETARVHECAARTLGIGDEDPAFWEAVRHALVDLLREIDREPEKITAGARR